MARRTKPRTPTPDVEDDDHSETLEQPTEINPYEVLSVSRDATADQIKTAYRKAALRHHPDKVSPETRDDAHKKFQEIAFAYAVLSDEKRRNRYDTTGNTSESLKDDEDFDWVDFFREQTAAMVDGNMIEQIKKDYQGSTEEKEDVLRVYGEQEGDMDALYETIICSNVLDDDERFRGIIDEAIENKDVPSYPAYVKETKAARKKRVQRAKAEEAEALELAEELGVKDKLFGKGSNGKAGQKVGKKATDEDALKALIQQRQKGRAESFIDNLEAKYGGGRSSKRKVDEPPEELFEKNAKKVRGKTR